MLNLNPKYANLKSLSYTINEVFTFFQEANGNAIDKFWLEIKKQQLPYKRENKLGKILKRRKINNDREYEFVIDVIVPYRQENLIDENDILLLNKLIGEFENSKKKKI